MKKASVPERYFVVFRRLEKKKLAVFDIGNGDHGALTRLERRINNALDGRRIDIFIDRRKKKAIFVKRGRLRFIEERKRRGKKHLFYE